MSKFTEKSGPTPSEMGHSSFQSQRENVQHNSHFSVEGFEPSMGQDWDLGIPEIDDSGMSKNYALVAENLSGKKGDPPRPPCRQLSGALSPAPLKLVRGMHETLLVKKDPTPPPFEEFPGGGLGCSGDALRSESK